MRVTDRKTGNCLAGERANVSNKSGKRSMFVSAQAERHLLLYCMSFKTAEKLVGSWHISYPS